MTTAVFHAEAFLPLPSGCRRALFRERKKRFTVLAEMDGRPVQAHTNNSGAMLGLLSPGVEVVLSPAPGAKRKLPWTLELVKHQGFWVGVNTLVPNRMLKAAWKAGSIPELKGWDRFRPEVRVMDSRLDACLERDGQRLWVEAKNVTLVEDEVASFPDAVSIRARRHLTELMALAAQGDLVACFYLVQRPDGRCFGPADFIDPDFADVFRQARRAGVRMWAYAATVDTRGIGLGVRLPLTSGHL